MNKSYPRLARIKWKREACTPWEMGCRLEFLSWVYSRGAYPRPEATNHSVKWCRVYSIHWKPNTSEAVSDE